MIKYIIFGCGESGQQAICELGAEKIAYFIDNNRTGEIGKIPIYSLEEGISRKEDNMLILITSEKYRRDMMKQLSDRGVEDYLFYSLGSMIHSDKKIKLGREEWGKLYGSFHVEKIAERLKKKEYTVWTEEILKMTKPGDRILEIGCGSGQSSVTLAIEGRSITAMDYTSASIDTVNLLCKKMNTYVDTICWDATKELPFEENEFEVVFQAGLLEHFNDKEQIAMLKNWKRVCKRMVSMIPNANSILYRAGKEKMERDDNWPFGLETPRNSMYDVFLKSGITNIKEYTIGMQNAKDFLPKDHYLRVAVERMIEEGYDVNSWGQGYLLVTSGDC